MKKNTYTIPLALVFCLFFLWAISSNLLPTMIRQLMKTCELNTFEASFTETAYWLAYFIFPIPIAMFMKRYSYKAGSIFGLLLAALGGLLFFPAAMLKAYWAYLCIFFIIATGMCFLETAANPYVTVLGAPETAPRRLNLAQSFNGLGAFISAMFLSKLILSGTHYTRDTLPVDYPGGWQAYIQVETDAMKFPYLMLALLLIIIAVVFVFSKLPQIGDESKTPSSGSKKEKLIDFGVLKHSHLCWGVIAQFFYNGGQTAINSLFLVYCCSYAGLPEETATTFFGLYMLAFLVGRWIGTGLMVKFRPQDMLLVYSFMNILLCGLRFDYVEGTDSSPVGYLEGIFVLEEYKKRGYAKELLGECQNWAKDQGCLEFASDCELDNEDSLKFHLKMGFAEANRIICFTKRLTDLEE